MSQFAAALTEQPLLYVASPYSSGTPLSLQDAYECVRKAVARLLADGIHCMSPIVHNHPMAQAHEFPVGWEFWGRYDLRLMRACTGVLVLRMEGWDRSKGVRAEIDMAARLGLPIFMADPDSPLDMEPYPVEPSFFAPDDYYMTHVEPNDDHEAWFTGGEHPPMIRHMTRRESRYIWNAAVAAERARQVQGADS